MDAPGPGTAPEGPPWQRAWVEERPRLLGLAYRILGTFADAEEMVGEAAARLAALPAEQAAEVRSWPAYLTTMTTRLAVDRLRSAARTREEYPGPWLPEPVAVEDVPARSAEERDLLRLGLLHLMEQLRPEDRAAYVLRHAFAYSAPEIAEILDRSPSAVRQMLSRANRRLDAERRPRTDASRVRTLLDQLVASVTNGDIPRTTALISENAVLWTDGGGVVQAALNPVLGAPAVARFLHGIIDAAVDDDAAPPRALNTAGDAATLLTLKGVPRLLCIETDGERITALRMVSNPSKLERLLRSAPGG